MDTTGLMELDRQHHLMSRIDVRRLSKFWHDRMELNRIVRFNEAHTALFGSECIVRSVVGSILPAVLRPRFIVYTDDGNEAATLQMIFEDHGPNFSAQATVLSFASPWKLFQGFLWRSVFTKVHERERFSLLYCISYIILF